MDEVKTTDELSCQELVELMTDYLEDRLATDDRRRFEEHLSSCDGCAVYIEQMRSTIALTGRLREDDLDPGIRQRLLATFRAWRAGTQS